MHHKTKEKAVADYGKLHKAGATAEELKEAIAADEKGFTTEEVEEIFQAITGTPDAGDTPPAPPPPTKSKSKYPLYDLWKVDVENLKADGEGNAKQVRYTAIKKLRDNVKIEDHVADQLNAQSHNSLRRYYSAGSVTNGNEETVTITR